MTTEKTESANRAIEVDIERCMACGACEMACSEGHLDDGDFLEAMMEERAPMPRIKLVAAASGRPVPVQCRHCEDAPCIAACSTRALHRDDGGRVLFVQEQCISCRACERVCPYGAISWDEREDIVVKCDVCSGLRESEQQPFCVEACPTGCLRTVVATELHGTESARHYDSLLRDESRIGRAGPDIHFRIDSEICICCGRCARMCPVDCISGKAGKAPAKSTDEDLEKGKVGEPFVINGEECIGCGTCYDVCPVEAVIRG